MATTHQESSNSLSLLSGVYRKTRTLFLSALILGLVATNVASLISDAFHNSLYGALSRLVNALPSFHSKNKLLQKSPTSVRQAGVQKATGKLRAEKNALIKKNTDLTQRHNKLVHRYNGLANTNTSLVNRYNGLAKDHNTQRKQHLATRKSYDELKKITRVRAEKLQTFSTRMSSRSAKIAAANVAALPAEFVPVAGMAAIISMTALDVYLLCEGMQELNSVRQTFGFSKEDETRVCGIKVPKKEAVQKEVADNYHVAVARAKKYISW